MSSAAFAPPSFVGVRLAFTRQPLQKRSTRHYHVYRRLRVAANGNLYPDVDPPESIESPLNSTNSSGETFLDKLNRERATTQDADVVSVPLDASDEDAVTATPTKQPDFMSATAPPPPPVPTGPEVDYLSAARALWRLGWVTWWSQLVLTVISGVILLFSFAFPGVSIRTSASLVGFVLAAVGIFLAFISLFWTYSYTQLSVWLETSPKRTFELARSRIIGKLRVGLVLCIVGLLVSLTGLQAIVGTLLARLLSSGIATTPYTAYPPGAAGGVAPGAGLVQPVDVLVVQACANAMTALAIALTVTVWLRGRARKWLGMGNQ